MDEVDVDIHRGYVGDDIKGKDQWRYYYNGTRTRVYLTVDYYPSPDGIYKKFTHTPKKAKIGKVKNGSDSSGFHGVTFSNYPSVSVWYWTGDSEHKNPLVVQLGTGEEYYTSYKGYSWSRKSTITHTTLKNYLDQENCELNRAHEWNIPGNTTTPPKCSHCNATFKVERVHEGAFRYTKCSYSLHNNLFGNFSVSSFKVDGTPQHGMAVVKATDDIDVYFDSTDKIPLVLHYICGGANFWYMRMTETSDNWTEVAPEDQPDAESIGISVHKVISLVYMEFITLDIKRNGVRGRYQATSTTGKEVTIEYTGTREYGCCIFTHKRLDIQPFKLKSVIYEDKTLDEVSSESIITEARVYYWEKDVAFKTPLLIELVIKGHKYEYFVHNGKNKWKKETRHIKLTDLLEVLNCTLNRVAYINIIQQDGSKYCPDLDRREFINVTSTDGFLYWRGFRANHHVTNERPSKEFRISRMFSRDGELKFPADLEFPIMDAKYVTVYYWNGNWEVKTPLMIKLDPGTYYTTDDNKEWTKCGSKEMDLDKALMQRNCKRNGLHTIDISLDHGSYYACLGNCGRHFPLNTTIEKNEYRKSFHYAGDDVKIGGYRCGQDALLMVPVNDDITKVFVFHYPLTNGKPLLIYIPKGKDCKWYTKKPFTKETWDKVTSNQPQDENDYDKILNLLKKYHVPEVTINIDKTSGTYQSYAETVNVEKKPYDNYTQVTHRIGDKIQFKLMNIIEQSKDTNISFHDPLTHVMAYYWKEDIRQALMIDLVTNNTHRYYYFDDRKWNVIILGNAPVIDKLDEVNSKLHDFLFFDISKAPSRQYEFPREAKVGEYRLTDIVRFNDLRHYVTYESSFKLHKIKNGSNTMEITGRNPPYINVKGLIVYYWDGDHSFSRPLALRFEGEDPFYTSMLHYKWERETTKPTLQDALDRWNCHHNKAHLVEIDLTGGISCFSCRFIVVKSTEDAKDSHRLKKYTHKCNGKDVLSVSAFLVQKVPQQGIILPSGVESVDVYFYPEDLKIPILIHYSSGSKHHWFKKKSKKSNEWERWDEEENPTEDDIATALEHFHHPNGKPQPKGESEDDQTTSTTDGSEAGHDDEHNDQYTHHGDEDDPAHYAHPGDHPDDHENSNTLKTGTSHPEVTIELDQTATSSYKSDGQMIVISKTKVLGAYDYLKVTHKIPGRVFLIKCVVHGQILQTLESGSFSKDPIQSLAVFYYVGDSNFEKPLLVELVKADETYLYHCTETVFTNYWVSLPRPGQNNVRLIGTPLKEELDKLKSVHFPTSSHVGLIVGCLIGVGALVIAGGYFTFSFLRTKGYARF